MFNNTSNLIDYKKLYEKLDGNYAVMSALDKIFPQKIVGVTAEPPELKLNMISCPCCGQGEVRKTKIDRIVECIYCNRQFTLSY